MRKIFAFKYANGTFDWISGKNIIDAGTNIARYAPPNRRDWMASALIKGVPKRDWDSCFTYPNGTTFSEEMESLGEDEVFYYSSDDYYSSECE